MLSLDENIDYRINKWDLIIIWVSILFHLFDSISDTALGCYYLWRSQYLNATLTLLFVFVSSLVNTGISVHMHHHDSSMGRSVRSLSYKFSKLKILWILSLPLQLSPIIRCYDTYQYGRKCQKAERDQNNFEQKKYYKLKIDEDSDIALLRIFECFIEASPQLILQITILLLNKGDLSVTKDISVPEFHLALSILQWMSIVSSFVTIAWSITSYQRNIRLSQVNKYNISCTGSFILFMWHFSITVSRIVSIALGFSVDSQITIIILALHWVIMTSWLSTREETGFCIRNSLLELLFYGLFGFVYVFTFISLSDTRTKCKYIFYYFVCAVENVFSAAFYWALVMKDDYSNVYNILLIALCVIPFLTGIIFMLVYYNCYHPTLTDTDYNES